MNKSINQLLYQSINNIHGSVSNHHFELLQFLNQSIHEDRNQLSCIMLSQSVINVLISVSHRLLFRQISLSIIQLY